LNLFRPKKGGISAAFCISLNVHVLTLFQPARRSISLATHDAYNEGSNFCVRAQMEEDLFASVKCVLFFPIYSRSLSTCCSSRSLPAAPPFFASSARISLQLQQLYCFRPETTRPWSSGNSTYSTTHTYVMRTPTEIPSALEVMSLSYPCGIFLTIISLLSCGTSYALLEARGPHCQPLCV
jgi:hypothetical protein